MPTGGYGSADALARRGEAHRAVGPTEYPIAGINPVDAHYYVVPEGSIDYYSGDSTPAPTSKSPFSLDESAKYFLVLVALCEPRLRNSTSVALPSDKELLARLRPLAGCEELTRSAVNFHIDYLARVKLRLRDAGDEPSTEGRRNGLVNFALRFDLVRDEHLVLLRPPT